MGLRRAVEPHLGGRLPLGLRGRDVRAGDAERELAAVALRRHFAAGRLDEDELEARLERVVAARTRGELATVMSDLPSDRGARALRRAYRVQRGMLPYHAAGWATFNGALIGVWELTGAGGFWPAFGLAPSTALLVGHALSSRAFRRSLGLKPDRKQRG